MTVTEQAAAAINEMSDYHYFVNSDRVNTTSSIFYANYFFNEAKYDTRIIWNWWPFLFGPFWFFARKLYISMFLFVLLLTGSRYLGDSVASFLSRYVHWSVAGGVKICIWMLPTVLAGYAASYLYYRKFLWVAKNAPQKQVERNRYFGGKGGVSRVNIALSVAFCLYMAWRWMQ